VKKIKPKREFWIWLAGFIDGEGCIGFRNSGDKYLNGNLRHALRVRIANTNKETLDYIKEEVGFGFIYKAWRQPRSSSHKQGYIYEVGNKQASIVLEKIMPNLKTKRLQAELAVEYQRTKKSGRLINDEIHNEREEIKAKIRTLNQRGVLSAIA